MPFVQLPNGETIAQAQSITRYLGKLVTVSGEKLYSDDPLVSLKVDEIMDTFDDVRGCLVPTFSIKDQAEKEAARQAVFDKDTKATKILTTLEARCVGPFYFGSTMTLADVYIFWFLRWIGSGFWDGLGPDTLKDYVKLESVAKNVGKHPALQSYYGGRDGQYANWV